MHRSRSERETTAPARLALAVIGAAFALALSARDAHAADTVPVYVTVPGSVSLRGVGPLEDARAGCTSPCTLRLAPGEYRYSGNGRKDEPVAITGPSHLSLVPPAEPLHTAALGVAAVGVLTIFVPLVVAFATCNKGVDAYGRVTDSRCIDFDSGADLPLTIVAGAGLGLAAIGGIVYFLTAGGLSVTDFEPSEEARTGPLPRARREATFRLDLSRGAFVF